MFKQRPIPLSILVLAIFIALYSVGYNFSLYIFYPQFEILLKALSGLWVSLVILGLAAYFGQFSSLKDYKIKSFLIAFISAAFIGTAWELVQNLYKLTDVAAPNYNLITAFNILTNALGGTLAHFYFVRRKKDREEVVEIQYPFKSQ